MTKVATTCFLSLIHCDSRMRFLSRSLRFSYMFSLYAYTYHIFGGVFSSIESYY